MCKEEAKKLSRYTDCSGTGRYRTKTYGEGRGYKPWVLVVVAPIVVCLLQIGHIYIRMYICVFR